MKRFNIDDVDRFPKRVMAVGVAVWVGAFAAGLTVMGVIVWAVIRLVTYVTS